MAFFSDIHSNLPALQAVLAGAEADGVDKFVCTGDLTGYGPFPVEVCRLLEERRVLSVAGNYDQKVMEVSRRGPSATEKMNPKKRKILLWTVARLDDRTLVYLASLPGQTTPIRRSEPLRRRRFQRNCGRIFQRGQE
jgi:predicted phosphodiesterase